MLVGTIQTGQYLIKLIWNEFVFNLVSPKFLNRSHTPQSNTQKTLIT